MSTADPNNPRCQNCGHLRSLHYGPRSIYCRLGENGPDSTLVFKAVEPPKETSTLHFTDSEKRSLEAVKLCTRRLHPFPSREAQAAHSGKWMCVCDGHIVVGRFHRPDSFLHGEHEKRPSSSFVGYSIDKEDAARYGALFWPVDDYGNKLERWPLEGG